MAAKAGTTLKETAPPKAVEPDDNVRALTPEEEREARLLRFLDKHRTLDDQIEEIMVALRGKKKLRNALRGEMKRDGWILGLIDEQLKEEALERRDRDAREAQRAFIRTVCGSPVGKSGTQQDILEEMDEESWALHGYNAGVAGRKAEPPKELPPEFLQRWMGEHRKGAERLAWSMAEEGVNPDRAPGATGTGPTAREIKGEEEPDGDDETEPEGELV